MRMERVVRITPFGDGLYAQVRCRYDVQNIGEPTATKISIDIEYPSLLSLAKGLRTSPLIIADYRPYTALALYIRRAGRAE
jgi:hypothetical protein